jgi:EAL domain-containing protein (putative c-di-GMP-specific phosphodiesterase class I)
VRAVVGLSSSLGITTTAEGVETKEELASVKAEGCNEFQGFHLVGLGPPWKLPAFSRASATGWSRRLTIDAAHSFAF